MISDATPGTDEATSGQSRLRQWASVSLGFDLRSLALLRIVAPSVYLLELLLHWKYLETTCTDSGILPRSAVFESMGEAWSVYLAFGSLEGVQFLYVCHMLAVACLIVGWRVRWASLACYVFTTSLQNRFPALPGWECEMRLLFLIGVFLPWGEWLSLDARGRQERPTFSVSAATVAWRIQVLILYLASGLLKGGPGWEDGTAVEVSLASDAYATPLGLWVLSHCQHFPQVLPLVNDAVPLVEIFTPLFLLSPFGWVQMAWVVVLWLLHAGFGLCLRIGMFSPICCACLLGFVPSGLWSRVGLAAPRREAVPLKLWETVFLTWVSLSMLASALEGLPELKGFVRAPAHAAWKVLGLEQHWTMFVPPPFENGWHVIKGKTAQGKWVDLLSLPQGGQGEYPEASEERPEWVSSLYPGVRGYLFLAVHLRSTEPEKASIRESVADYYRRRWEASHPGAQDRLGEVEILFYRRQYAPGKGFNEAERMLIYSRKY